MDTDFRYILQPVEAAQEGFYFTSATSFTAILYVSARTTHIVSVLRLAVKVIRFIGKRINSSGWLWRASCRVSALLG